MNIKPDLIVIWPTYFDFPGFRLQLQRDKQYFNKIIIGLHYDPHNDIFSSIIPDFIQKEMNDPDTIFVQPQEINSYPSTDWFTRSICSCLRHVQSEWMLILQQDFIIHNPLLWPAVLTDRYDIIGRREAHKPHLVNTNVEGCHCIGEGNILDARWAPDFLLIRTSIMETSNKDFSPGCNPITGVGMDVVGPWSIRVNQKFPNSSTLHTLGFHTPKDFEHLSGFIEAYRYLNNNYISGIGNKPRFRQYNQDVLKEIHKINVHPLIMELILKASMLEL